jgi:hypothetical protein
MLLGIPFWGPVSGNWVDFSNRICPVKETDEPYLCRI